MMAFNPPKPWRLQLLLLEDLELTQSKWGNKKDEEDGSPPQQHMGTSAGVCKPSKTGGML